MITSKISRRNLVAGSASLALLPSLVRGQTPDATTPDTGEWTFTDSNGVTVTLPQAPTRIAADISAASALWDFGIRPIVVSGSTTRSDIAWGNVDRSLPVINASEESGAPDNEALVEYDIELFVDVAWHPGTHWAFSDEEAFETTRKFVPVVTLSIADDALTNLEGFADFAAALGADLDAPDVVEARETFEAAQEAFRQLASEKSDVVSLFTAARDTAQIYIANPHAWADLGFMHTLGMNMVMPDIEDDVYFMPISVEQIITQESDVMFLSARTGNIPIEDQVAHPAISAHPAIASGQYGPWNQDFILSYQGVTETLTIISDVLSKANKPS